MTSVALDDANVWDDSALVNSWNEALAEYKKYHSIQARGEKVEDVLSAFELKQLKEERYFQRTGKTMESKAEPQAGAENGQGPDFGGDNKEVHEQAPQIPTMEAAQASGGQRDAPTLPSAQATSTSAEAPANVPPMFASGQQDPLKNLMMSWYYAGYYQGLYEGQQKAATDASGKAPK